MPLITNSFSAKCLFFKSKVGASREFFFSGKVLQKPVVDLILANYPDGLPIPGVSKFSTQVPTWNKQVQNFIKFTIGFCRGYLHDDGALLLFILDSVQVKKEVLSYLYNNNLEVKEEWTIVNSLHLIHPMHNSKRVSISNHFPLFNFSYLHELNHITNSLKPIVDVQTLKFKAIVLARSFSTPLVRQPKEFVISSSNKFHNVDLANDDVLFNIVTANTALKCKDSDTFWKGFMEKAVSMLQLLISGLSFPGGIICDLSVGTSMTNLFNSHMFLDLGNLITCN